MPVYRLFAAVCCLGLATFARAQESPVRMPTSLDSLVSDFHPGNTHIRKALVDSLNRLSANRLQLPQLPDVKLPAAGFGDLRDPMRGQFLSYINATSGPAKFAQLQQGFGVLKDSARMERFLDDKLRGFYALFKDHPAAGQLKLPGKPDNKLQKAGAQTAYGDTTGNASGWWSNIEVQDRFSLGAIPVNLNYANVSGHSRMDHDLTGENLGNLKFDREAYLQKVSAHVKKNYDLKKYFLDDIDFKQQLNSFLEHKMKALDKAGDSLSLLIRPQEVLQLDSIQLRNQLFANAAKKGPGMYPDSVLNKQVSALLALKEEVGGGLDTDEMLRNQRKMKSQVDRYLNDPGAAAEMAPDLIPLSGLQRLFMKLKELNAGQIAANASKGTVSDLFMTGVTGTLLNKQKLLMLGAGKTREALPYDIGLQNMQHAPAQSLQFLRMGKGDLDKPHHHISMINANAKSDKRMPDARVIMQNTFVGALSNRISLGDIGTIDFEFSKSNNSTGTGGQTGDHSALSRAAVAHYFDDFMLTLSTGFRYTGSLPEYGTTHSVYFNYAGLGYNNPGNPYSRRGSFAYGGLLKRVWLRNKASMQFRTDFRNTDRSAVTGSQWKNRTFALDGRYRLSKKLTLSGRMHQSNMLSTGVHGRQEQYLNRKVSFASQWNGKFAGFRFFNQSSLGLQQLHYMTAETPLKSLFLNAFVNHTIPVGGQMITANVFYNYDMKGAAIYANLLTADAGYQFRLAKFLQCGSSLTFLDNRGVVRQVGFRQQVGAQVLGRCQVNLSLDARQNLINTPQNYLYGNFRSDLSIFYMLN